ncbi:MAG: CDP-glucose 4,6-dehydratase [Puniceicoccales bacterium]|nr:CDP-glucose 4,6-dehydratase [Puniceicoccales bacterium]
MLKEFYKGRRILLTGHTGFKGSWLAEWLLMLGADLTGLALEPPTAPALFTQLKLGSWMRDLRGDVRDRQSVADVIARYTPELVIHMAAQPLVRLSYDIPAETFETNVMGTVNVLDAIRAAKHPCATLVVTTDKCYENREWLHSYREEDPMGGYDPYSASKGCAELVVSAYRRSFFGADSPVALASARAGNVIGGGDWALDRIVPDCVRSLAKGETIPVRNPHATRPWQHVLEPLSGYLLLGARLLENVAGGSAFRRRPENAAFESAFNFGPALESNKTVGHLVTEILKNWPGQWENQWRGDALHEASLLNLSTDKAYHLLGWRPRWSFEETIAHTTRWYQEHFENKSDVAELTRRQIVEYSDVPEKKLTTPPTCYDSLKAYVA